jgi:4,5:9,10-diseco-3-hydroxy-5,9,17-trioxoandrosta-1(10),2-diene-4-oate hydrolase
MNTQTPQDLFIQVGDIKTRYWEAGENGSQVVFVHGIGSFIEHWEQNLKALSKHYHVYAVDLVGFGLTEKPSVPYSIPFLAKFVQDFMEAKGIKSASVVGNSLGAMIAIELSLMNSKIVDKLILLDGGFFGRNIAIAFRLLTIPFIGEQLMRPNRDGTEQFLKLMFSDESLVTEEMVSMAFERNTQSGAAEAYLTTLRSGVNFLGLKQELVNRTSDNADCITAPTLVVWGSDDNILPVEHAHKAAKILPNANLHVFEKCGHMPQIECAEEFNDLAVSFLAE